jgi:hypothetical protein
LEPSERLACEEIHHHDIVHFALAELERQIVSVLDDEVFNLPRDRLRAIRDYPLAPKSADSPN